MQNPAAVTNDAFALLMLEAASAGGHLALNQWKKRTVTKDEGGGGLTTEQDARAQEIIFSRLRKHFPADEVIGEESENHADPTAKSAFIVDPIDGTVDYDRGAPDWCVNIAHTSHGHIDRAVIYQPRTGRNIIGIRGEGVFIHDPTMPDYPCFFLPHPDFTPASFGRKHTILQMPLTGDFSDEVIEKVQVPLIANTRFVRNVICNGASTIEMVLGICDGFVGYGSLWDFAPGILFIEELGGIVSDMWGNPIDLSLIKPQRVVFARSKEVHQGILQYTKNWPREDDIRSN